MGSLIPAKGQTSMISIVIIAGLVIGMIGAAYVWAMPMVEKRITITDFSLIENFMIEVNENIVEIANTGSGEAAIQIPKGMVTARGIDSTDPVNNSIIIEFDVSQPIMLDGEVPLRTSSLDEIGDYGKTEPRTLIASASTVGNNRKIRMTMRYRELRSATPKGYLIALCPSTGCAGSIQGGNEVVVRYISSETVHRDSLEGGDLTVTYISIEVR